jgi:D-lyxose ketol-isomerase
MRPVLTMMQLLVMIRLKRVLMLRPSQISTMHRHMLLIEELQMGPS